MLKKITIGFHLFFRAGIYAEDPKLLDRIQNNDYQGDRLDKVSIQV
jgi:hypothetical protein